jgi:hypothetical protein
VRGKKKKEESGLHRKSFDCSKPFAQDYFHVPPELGRFRGWFLPTADGERLNVVPKHQHEFCRFIPWTANISWPK